MIKQEKQQKKHKQKIGHSLQELEEGLILTLQDKSILKGDNLNEDDDIFENQEIRKINETEHNRQIREKSKTIANAVTSHLEAKNEGKKGILPHYDDYEYKADEVDVEEGVVVTRSRPKAALKKKLPSDFEEKKQNTVSEYFVGKKFKNRKQQKSNSGELLDFLTKTAQQKDDQEPLQRSAQDIIGESLDKVRKRRKTQNESKQLTINTNMEQDQLLARAIKLTRQKNLKSNVLEMIKQQDEDNVTDQKYTEIQLNPINYRPLDKQLEQNKKYDIKDVVKGTTSCLFMNLPSEKIVKKEEEYIPESFKELTEEQLQKMKQQISFMEDRAQGIGMAGTLKYLRQHNMLGKQQQFGRNNDKSNDLNDPNDRIKLEYRNASGKLMKPKQAFRYMSAIFHGRGPGKNKIEKMKKKQLMEMRMKEAASKNQGKFLSLLEKHQQKTGQAHMVINIGSKNRKDE